MASPDSQKRQVRRLITGVDPDGRSVFTFDEEVEEVVSGKTGMSYWGIWGADGPTVLPSSGRDPYRPTIFPSEPEGYRVHVIEFPAAGERHQARGEWPEYGLGEWGRKDDPSTGQHWTTTIDCMVVLSGSIGLEQDGVLKVLHPGDVLVQNGATHAWRLQAQPCRVMFVALGADRPGAAAV